MEIVLRERQRSIEVVTKDDNNVNFISVQLSAASVDLWSDGILLVRTVFVCESKLRILLKQNY